MKRHLASSAAVVGVLALAAPTRAATTPTEIVLHSFAVADGAHPIGGVIISAASPVGAPILIGTAYSGGAHNNGTVFSLANAKLTVLHSFLVATGRFPQARVTEGPGGVLYGTLSGGGDKTVSHDGSGAVFSLKPDGTFTTLHLFQGPDGSQPVAPVTLDAAGNLLGTTQFGGRSTIAGVAFKVAPDGTTTTLVDFTGTHCSEAIAPITLDASGNLFSTTWMNPGPASGCVWKYGTDGKFTLVHMFGGPGQGGREPRGGVAFGTGGLLYGTNFFTGNTGPGTLFSVAPDGTEKVLHRFTCGADGGFPSGQVLIAKGVLYGTTSSCGKGVGGTVFSYNTVTGAYTILHAFVGGSAADGYEPLGPLAMDAQGNLYGTTEYGGTNDFGVVYEIRF